MAKIIAFIRKETVLTAAWLLAVISAFIVPPSPAWAGYIDFRSLGILWSMMVIMAGLRSHGFFRRVGELLLARTRGTLSLILVLVYLCFFFSMLITNDVSLLTFVPFTLALLGENGQDALIIPVVVLQTLAANLGSMLTPIGNPQNLYLYGLSGLSILDFCGLMLPYTAATAILLFASCLLAAGKGPKAALPSVEAKGPKTALPSGEAKGSKTALPSAEAKGPKTAMPSAEAKSPKTALSSVEAKSPKTAQPYGDGKGPKTARSYAVPVYGALFLVTLLSVLRILPWYLPAALILAVVFGMEKKILLAADYGLLLTFVGFFIFTGNMGSVESVASGLGSLVQGHEITLGVLASQIISNVPAALLLSGFTADYPALIIGVNLGGLGTLIASMASLISYKFVAAEKPRLKGRYFLLFTEANVAYLMILWGMAWILTRHL